MNAKPIGPRERANGDVDCLSEPDISMFGEYFMACVVPRHGCRQKSSDRLLWASLQVQGRQQP